MKWIYNDGDTVPIDVTDVIVKDGIKEINSTCEYINTNARTR